MKAGTLSTFVARVDAAEFGICRMLNALSRRPPVRRLFQLVSRLGDGAIWYALLLALLLWQGRAGLRPALVMVLIGLSAGLLALLYAVHANRSQVRAGWLLIGVALGVALLRRSALGSAMLAVRANERSAAASGINVVRTKIAAFAIAAFIAGLGGSMYAYRLGNVTWDSFDVLLGLGVFAVVYVAGMNLRSKPS